MKRIVVCREEQGGSPQEEDMLRGSVLMHSDFRLYPSL